jgi:hypothetical protein
MGAMYDINGNKKPKSKSKSRSTKSSVKLGVGPSNSGFFNLKDNARGAGGRFISTPNAAPRSIEAFRWPSIRGYHTQSLNSQLKVLAENLTKFSKHLGNEAPTILLNALGPTFNKSRVYCPKDTMLLVNSGRLEIKSRKGSSNTTVSISYGNSGIPFYAVLVHEILSYKHASPTRAKFLESAVREDMKSITGILTEESKKIFGK